MAVSEKVQIGDVEHFADGLNPGKAAEIYKNHGCLVIRGLMKGYVEAVSRDIEATAKQYLAHLDQAEEIPEGWRTPSGRKKHSKQRRATKLDSWSVDFVISTVHNNCDQ